MINFSKIIKISFIIQYFKSRKKKLEEIAGKNHVVCEVYLIDY